jgi:hypothetical protein
MEESPIYQKSAVITAMRQNKQRIRKSRPFTCTPIIQKEGSMDYDLQMLNLINRYYYRLKNENSKFLFSITTSNKDGLPFYAFFLGNSIYTKSMSDMITKMKYLAQEEFKSTYAEIKELVISEVIFVAKEKKSKKSQTSLVQQIMNMTAEEKELLKQILNK